MGLSGNHWHLNHIPSEKKKIKETKRGCIILNSVITTVCNSVWLQLKVAGEARAMEELKLKTARVSILRDYN